MPVEAASPCPYPSAGMHPSSSGRENDFDEESESENTSVWAKEIDGVWANSIDDVGVMEISNENDGVFLGKGISNASENESESVSIERTGGIYCFWNLRCSFGYYCHYYPCRSLYSEGIRVPSVLLLRNDGIFLLRVPVVVFDGNQVTRLE